MNPFGLYLLFVKIGIFTFGGGYAMIPLFHDELVINNSFLTAEEFANMIALAQMTPGPVGLNAATYIGYQQAGLAGACAGTLGIVTPSLTLGLLVAIFIQLYRKNTLVQEMLKTIRPATVGLIAAAVIFFANTSVFTAPLANLWTKGQHFGISWQGTVIFILTILVEIKYKPSLILVLLGAAVLTPILYLF